MSAQCHAHTLPDSTDPRYRRILWIALALNLAMFIVELTAGMASDSVSLLADAIDFFGDAANYGVSLAVLSMTLAARAKAALLKAACILGFGLFALGKAAGSARADIPPEAITVGVLAISSAFAVFRKARYELQGVSR